MVVVVAMLSVVWPWLIVVSSTPCGVAVVLVVVAGMAISLHCHVEDLGARRAST